MLFNAKNAMLKVIAGSDNALNRSVRLTTHPADTQTDSDPTVEYIDYIELTRYNLTAICRMVKVLNAKYLENPILVAVDKDDRLVLQTADRMHELVTLFHEGISKKSFMEIIKLKTEDDAYISVYALAGFDYTAITEDGADYLCKYRVFEDDHLHSELVKTAGQYHVIFD